MIKLTIDNKEVFTEEGNTVLTAALDAGIYIPHLCSHPDLPVISGCRMCLVLIEGHDGVECSCEVKAEEGMIVHTRTEEIDHLRIVAMELMLAGHPHDCSSCKRYLKCEFQALMQYLGVVHARMRTVRKNTNVDVSPLINRENERCIQCGRCVRVCEDIRGLGILKFNRNNGEIYVGAENGKSLADAGCRFCSACVEVCPTGALTDQIGIFRTDITKSEALVPCQAECPAGIDIPGFLRFAKEEKFSEAVGIIREKVPFPLTLGYVCNKKCETGCKHAGLNSPVSIKNAKKFLVQNDKDQIWKERYIFTQPDTGKKVAVVGSGPCGLTAAYYLKKKGHDVTVFEKNEIPGGPMTLGMPEFRIHQQDVLEEIKIIEETGVKIKCGCEIKNLTELKEQFDAVLLATGVPKGKILRFIKGADSDQVFTAVDILADIHRNNDLSKLGKTVCVIGSGSIGFDVARSLIRKGFTVNMACIEKAGLLMADEEEQKEGIEEGINLFAGRSFEKIENEGGKVTGLRVHTVESSTYDRATGQVTEVAVKNSQETISCDSIVFAVGQHSGLLDYKDLGIKLNKFGYPVDLKTQKSGNRTSIDGVFAAGDVITGISFVINAVQGARSVVPMIDKYLGGDGIIDETLVERIRNPHIGKYEGAEVFAFLERNDPEEIPAEERIKNFDPIVKDWTCTEGVCEAGRCLQCDLRKDISPVPVWTEYNKK